MDYMGTAVFALSGTVTAGQVGMDLMGTWNTEKINECILYLYYHVEKNAP